MIKPEPWKPIIHSTMDEHAQEIGRLCIYWSELEMYVGFLLLDMLAIKDATTKNVVFGLLDFRTKLQALVPMGFARKPNEQWFAALEKVVNHVDNDLRPERNRMIHDTWMGGDPGTEETIRIQITPKVVNEQARKKVLKLAVTKAVKAEEIGKLYEKVIAASARINQLRNEYQQLSTLPHALVAQALLGRQNLAGSPPAPPFPLPPSPKK